MRRRALARRARPLGAACALGAASMAAPAHGADHFSAEAFEPATTQEGSVLSVYGTRTLPKGSYYMGSAVSYARSPISLRDGQSGEGLGDLVGSLSTLSLLGSYGIMDRFDLGVAVPLHRVSAGSDFGAAALPAVEAAAVNETQFAMGDVRVVPRVTLVQREGDSGVGLAALLPISLPTGKDDVYGGEDLRVEPRLAVDFKQRGMLVAANLGYLLRSEAQVLDSTVDDMVRWGVGADVPIWNTLSGVVEASGAINAFSADFASNDAPTEGLLGLRLRQSGWLAQLAGGPGVVHGLTAPQYRVLAAVGFSADQKEPDRDTDGDGLLDRLDACPQLTEDADRFEDADGCPDADNDQDGAPDTADACPTDAEDRDGFADADGCPDLDNDQDSLADAADRCANEPEDTDGFEDTDGCPDPDNDHDGVIDIEDQCPIEPGVAQQRGCKEPPEPASGNVQITDTKLELDKTVLFQRNRSTIEGESLPLLDEIASVLLAHPEITQLLVEGHTDDLGNRQLNVTLSQARAEAVVQALVQRGIEKTRLRAQGFGPDRPLAANDSDQHREQNRRVELRIEARTP